MYNIYLIPHLASQLKEVLLKAAEDSSEVQADMHIILKYLFLKSVKTVDAFNRWQSLSLKNVEVMLEDRGLDSGYVDFLESHLNVTLRCPKVVAQLPILSITCPSHACCLFIYLLTYNLMYQPLNSVPKLVAPQYVAGVKTGKKQQRERGSIYDELVRGETEARHDHYTSQLFTPA